MDFLWSSIGMRAYLLSGLHILILLHEVERASVLLFSSLDGNICRSTSNGDERKHAEYYSQSDYETVLIGIGVGIWSRRRSGWRSLRGR
jgi:hypothetical protein